MDKVLYKNIIATVTYYDTLDYPMTMFEIWKHLIRSNFDDSNNVWSFVDIYNALNSKDIKRYVSHKNGMYFLFGRDNLVKLRKERERISLTKMRKLKRIVSILRISPFIRMICVTGRLAYNNCDKDSDLDVLIVYKSGHIWTGRFCVTLLAHLIGVRRYGSKINDRICLNYHITTQSLRVPTQDIFAAHEYTFIMPLFDIGYYMQFYLKNKKWIQNIKPNYKYIHIESDLSNRDNFVTKYLRTFFEIILSDKGMENRLKKIQLKKIKTNPKTYKKEALILCSDDNLIFLPKPHGPVIFEEYKRRFESLEVNF